eukprot:s2591_g1.t1
MGSSLALSTDQEDLRTARAQVPAAPAAAAAAEAEAAPAQDPLLDELVQRMARFERLEEDLRVDVDSHQGLLRALQETQRQLHSQQDAMKVDGISEMSKQLSRCEEQIEELQTQLLQVQLPGSSLALSTDQEVSLLPDFTERLEKCERQHQEFQQLLLSSSAKSESSEIARCEEQVKELRLLLHEQKSSRAEDPSFASAQGEMSQQISRCEQQVKELQQELREQKSSKPEVSAFNPHEDEDFTDHQLMLLDLQQRVSSLEGAPGELVASTPQSRGVLGQAAELMQKIELDLQQARAAVVPGLDMTPCAAQTWIPIANLQSLVAALRQKLQKHAVTRQWVGLDSDKQAVSQDEQELRQELEWQQNVTDALTSYGKVLETATYSLLEAHQTLMDWDLQLGISQNGGCPIAGWFYHGQSYSSG